MKTIGRMIKQSYRKEQMDKNLDPIWGYVEGRIYIHEDNGDWCSYIIEMHWPDEWEEYRIV